MNHADMVKEGNRLNAILDIQTNLLHEPGILPEQAKVINVTAKMHQAKIDMLAKAIHRACSCGHEKHDHKDGGRGTCLVDLEDDYICPCNEWAVDEL